MTEERVLVLGATSAIAREASRVFAENDASLFLVGRNQSRLDAEAGDLRVRGATTVGMHTADLADSSSHQALIDAAIKSMGGIDTAVVAYGIMGDHDKACADFSEAQKIIETNFTSVVSLLTLISNIMENQGSGTIAVITSVAGDRGRQSNYHYGAAKGALSIFLQGLRNRLHPKGVSVVTIKPGFVDTPMTAAIDKNPLYASPQKIGRGVFNAIKSKSDVVYLPWFWQPIMTAIKLVPEKLFKRLKL